MDQEEPELNRIFADANFDAVAIHDHGIVLEVNSNFLHLFGYERDEIIGQDGLQLLVAPESLEVVWEHVLAGDESPYEVKMKHRDGSLFPAELHAKMVVYQGRACRVVAVRDISLRQQAQARTQLLQELTAALSKALTPSEIASVIVDKALTALGGHYGSVGVLSEDGTRLTMLRMKAPGEIRDQFQTMPVDYPSPLAEAMRTRTPIWIEDQPSYLFRYPHLAEIIRDVTGSQAVACLPLLINEHILCQRRNRNGSFVLLMMDTAQS